MEANSLLTESGEKYVVLISKQSVEFLGHGEHSSGRVHVFRCVCVTIHIYVTDASSYIKNDGQFSFFKYSFLKYL